MRKWNIDCLFVAWVCIRFVSAEYSVRIHSNSPVISGGRINFTAFVMNDNEPAIGKFRLNWKDNSLQSHQREVDIENGYDSWLVEYDANKCPPGIYAMEVQLYKYYLLLPFYETSAHVEIRLTNTFSGKMQLLQNQHEIDTQFVSNNGSVVHSIQIKSTDVEYLNRTATQVLTFWFIDCDYVAITENLMFTMNYTTIGDSHSVEALVIPNFDPIPTEPPSTTTTSTTTPSPNSTTMHTKRKREAEIIKNFEIAKNNDIVWRNKKANQTYEYNNTFPVICENHTIIPIGSNTSYGYFSRKIVVKEPISKIAVTGNNWIQRYEVLDLLITCNGSSNFDYCYMFKDGLYNITGNETCGGEAIRMRNCEFGITRYFYDDKIRTIVIIISNDVSREIYPVTVTIYKVNIQAQVSVVVVPVVFSLAATVLIIFGIAYYLQNRSRFIVEVADFNFGHDFGELEYKTFKERLKESFTNAFTKAPVPSESSEGPMWPHMVGASKYDTMS